MDKWDLTVTHPYALAALVLSLLCYFLAARRRGWKESRLMNYIFGVLAVGVLVGGLALARREILKPKPSPKVDQGFGGARSAVPAKPPAPPPAVAPAAKRPKRTAESAPASGVKEPAAPPEPKEEVPEPK